MLLRDIPQALQIALTSKEHRAFEGVGAGGEGEYYRTTQESDFTVRPRAEIFKLCSQVVHYTLGACVDFGSGLCNKYMVL